MNKNILQKIKYNRFSEPEKILLDSFNNIVEDINEYGNIIYISNNLAYYIYIKNDKLLYYDYDLIYLKIKPYFNSLKELELFLINTIKKYLKIEIYKISEVDMSN